MQVQNGTAIESDMSVSYVFAYIYEEAAGLSRFGMEFPQWNGFATEKNRQGRGVTIKRHSGSPMQQSIQFAGGILQQFITIGVYGLF